MAQRKRPRLEGVEQLQAAVRAWIDEHHGGNQTEAARALGITQSQLSKIIADGTTVGTLTLSRLSRIAPEEVARIVRLPVSPTMRAGSPPLPNLDRAIEICEASVAAEAIDYVRTIAAYWPEDRPVSEWLTEIEAYDRYCQRSSA